MDRTTEMLSSFVCELNYNDLIPQTVHQVKRVLVDTLTCAMGGYLSEPAKIARQLASTVKSDGENGSRILGTRDSSSPEMAGFANSVMVRYLDYNDMSVGGHPSDSIPGPLAVAYPRGKQWSSSHHFYCGELRGGSPGGEPRAAYLSAWLGPRHPSRSRGSLRRRENHGPGP
jgi:2-methylcitrate dehydratase PrpD